MASIPKRMELWLLWLYWENIKVSGKTSGIDSKRPLKPIPIYLICFVEHALNNCHFLLFQNRGHRIMRVPNTCCENNLQGFGTWLLTRYALPFMIWNSSMRHVGPGSGLC